MVEVTSTVEADRCDTCCESALCECLSDNRRCLDTILALAFDCESLVI